MIVVNPDAPHWANAHINQEKVWHKQVAGDGPRADLRAYPAQGEEVQTWLAGVEMANRKATDFGIHNQKMATGSTYHLAREDVPLDFMALEEDPDEDLQTSSNDSKIQEFPSEDNLPESYPTATASGVDTILPEEEQEQVSAVLAETLNSEEVEHEESSTPQVSNNRHNR